uniref:Insulinoma-associated protein 2 n=1 Tax=Aceria tosichella TaxID=561515 RepID=A0A6G1SCY5_9ACAR
MNHSLVSGHSSLSDRFRQQQQRQQQDEIAAERKPSIMFSHNHHHQQDQVENEFRNIKLKLKGPNRHSELQAVKALMAMSAQQNLYKPDDNVVIACNNSGCNDDDNPNKPTSQKDFTIASATATAIAKKKRESFTNHRNHSRSESPEPIYGLAITMTEEEFKELAEREGIKDVIGEPICKLCGGLFSGPLGIALHMCPAMKRQTFRCEICGEDKWKTKANLHSHIKWCKKRLSMKTEQHHESKQIY